MLERLRAPGISLLDACATGVYDPATGSNRLGNAYPQIVRDSYAASSRRSSATPTPSLSASSDAAWRRRSPTNGLYVSGWC
jgi:hypothetical protein